MAVAQRQGERVALAVRTFPEAPLPEGEYVEAESIERHVLELRQRYPARVTAEASQPARSMPVCSIARTITIPAARASLSAS